MDRTPDRIRVLLVDDHVLVRTGLRMLLETDHGIEVVGEAGTKEQALAAAAGTSPDIILLDLDLGAERAIDFLEELQALSEQTRILILTGLRDPALHRESIQRGARGVLLKDQAGAALLKAIRKVHEGELWLDRTLTANLIDDIRGDARKERDPQLEKIATLTRREREVIALVAEGCRNREIAQRLFIAETTVRHHLTVIFSKLELGDRLGLALYAFRHNLAKPK